MAERPHPPDQGKASIQGVYDALRGGRRHLVVDQAAADELERAYPGTGDRMIEEQAFGTRVASWAAASGTRQLVVASAGMPAPAGRNLHEAARAVRPDSVAVYVCGDLYAAARSRAVLADGDPLVAVAEASVRSSEGILADPVIKTMIDFAEPVCVIVPMMVNFSPPPEAGMLLGRIGAPLAAGSVVAVSGWAGGDSDWAEGFSRVFRHRVWRHAAADIAGWTTAAGLRIVPEARGSDPGVVEARLWPDRVWADGKLPGRSAGRIVVAVGVRE